MNLHQQNQDKILKQLGLQAVMTKLPTSSMFVRYVTEEYRNSERRQTDEAYDMFEINILHKPSGIRSTLTSHEDYSGDVVYKVIRLFIMTTQEKELEVLNVDFENKIFVLHESCDTDFLRAIVETNSYSQTATSCVCSCTNENQQRICFDRNSYR